MKVFYVTHLAWKWLSPNLRKNEQNIKNYINIYFIFYAALLLLIVLHFILNNVCCKNENKSPNRNPSKNPSNPSKKSFQNGLWKDFLEGLEGLEGQWEPCSISDQSEW